MPGIGRFSLVNGHQAEEEKDDERNITNDRLNPTSNMECSIELSDIDNNISGHDTVIPKRNSFHQWRKENQISSDQVTAMLSNFSTSYNVVNISLVLPILQSPYLYKDFTTEDTDSICASALIGGMIIGQLLGGAIGDMMGRMNAMYFVMSLQVISSLGSAIYIKNQSDDDNALNDSNEEAMTIFEQLALWRFVLGIGAGGVYPLAAVLSAEQKSDDEGNDHDAATNNETDPTEESMKKLRMIAMTFSTQGVGFLAVPAVTFPLLYMLGEGRLDIVWRILLGLGSLPGFILLYLRWKTRQGSDGSQDNTEDQASLPNTERENANEEIENTKKHEDGESPDDVYELTDHTGGNDIVHDRIDDDVVSGRGLWSSIQNEKHLFRKLCGTAGTWFLFDIVFYGNTLFQPIVLETAFGTDDKIDDFHLLLNTASDAFLLSLIALPGYFISISVIGKRLCCNVNQTPKYIQQQGFAMMAILYLIIGILWNSLVHIQWLLVILYGSTFLFANYGPNVTTFMLPSLTFSSQCRSTLNGVSAACGKAGALLGASMFEPLSEMLGNDKIMILCAITSIFALVITTISIKEEDQDEEGHIEITTDNHFTQQPDRTLPSIT